MPTGANPRSKRRPLGPMVDVTVTAEIINTAIRADSGHCMIADAIRAAVPHAKKVSVDISTCRWSDFSRGFRYVYLTPRVAQEALVDFDEGVHTKPFRFRLRGAHVTRAGGGPSTGKKRTAKKNTGRPGTLPQRATLAPRNGDSHTRPDRVGGKRPPQLHFRREFGMRGFRAASLNRLKAEQPDLTTPVED